MYPRPYLPRRQGSGKLLPFLILITLGLTGILVFQIVSYFRIEEQSLTENKAALTVVKGQAQMLIWGEKEWIHAPTGSILREGDSLRVLPSSRATLAFLNGSFLRVHGGEGEAAFSFDTLRTQDASDNVKLTLQQGELWISETKREHVRTSFVVETNNFTIRSTGTVFNVSYPEFRVRVMEGKVDVDIKEIADDGSIRIIETIPVGVGQEIFINEDRLKQFRDRKSPDILQALSDEFKRSEWYAWNNGEDKKSSTALTVEEAVLAEKKEKPVVSKEPIPEPLSQPQEEVTFPPPEVLEPNTANRRTKSSKVLVRGVTSAKTQKIMVKTFVAGKEDAYVLQKYKPGSTEWNYLVDEAFGNWIPGRNVYHIIAVDANGEPSEPSELVLFYEKEKPLADLGIPKVQSFNGQALSETTEDAVKVEGTIGKGIVKVFINGFSLTRYVPNSGQWVYYAKTEYKNLKEGLNTYEVYGLDAEGRKTETLKFTILKKPKLETPPPFTNHSPLE